jgi:2-polyprenyl-3-methyl-5-hydroxy-6-metoxy-1,4-benzoquinol methylase
VEQQRACWDEVTEIMEDPRRVTLGRQTGCWFERTPQLALFYTAYYKFAAKMIGRGKRVLDVGCGEGLGTWLLATECGFSRGIGPDEDAIAVAKGNWPEQKVEFLCTEFRSSPPGQWDAVVSFDATGHFLLANAGPFLKTTADNLTPYGVAVVGAPNPPGQGNASEVSKAGHGNGSAAEQLEEEMRRFFGHVFMFSANEEVVHAGVSPVAHYVIALACKKRG